MQGEWTELDIDALSLKLILDPNPPNPPLIMTNEYSRNGDQWPPSQLIWWIKILRDLLNSNQKEWVDFNVEFILDTSFFQVRITFIFWEWIKSSVTWILLQLWSFYRLMTTTHSDSTHRNIINSEGDEILCFGSNHEFLRRTHSFIINHFLLILISSPNEII